jgi:uncharacterized protein YyaL (SSP411 family)
MSQSNQKTPNELIHASSPYLLQHAYNPVKWMEWGDEALLKAKRENKLLIVSVGYSSCHWCHVMEHESFEDKDTADIMNEFFVSIKVDREERPDIDQLYMDAVQLMSGRGGWPLNVVCLPDGRPIWGGTYFPQRNWNQSLMKLANFYRTEAAKAEEYAEKLANGIRDMSILPKPTEQKQDYKTEHILQFYLEIEKDFDIHWGGAGNPPKFPMPALWEFIGTCSEILPASQSATHLRRTLDAMSAGGLYDIAGGGFARYSVDEKWLVPHFEKMLYDNALLLSLFARQSQRQHNEHYNDVLKSTLGWLEREMKHPKGAYYSALDADSEGEEGKFYVWSKEELDSIATECKVDINQYFDQEAGYWEDDKIILRFKEAVNVNSKDYKAFIRHLLEYRETRIRPGLDHKILSGWNGWLLKGMADSWKVLQEQKIMDNVIQLADYLSNEMVVNNELIRTVQKNKADIPAFMEDYAAVINGLIAAAEVSGEQRFMLSAKQLCDFAIEHFFDQEQQLFAFSNIKEEVHISRKYETQDNVIPSCNSAIGHGLLTLWQVFEIPEYFQIVDGMLNRVFPYMSKFPQWHAHWAQLYSKMVKPPRTICISGKKASLKAASLHLANKSPDDLILFNESSHSALPIFKNRIQDELTYYVCEGQQCLQPVHSEQEALSLLSRQ